MKKGILLGFNEKNESTWFDENAHILTIAQSGAGKNTSIIMPNLLSNRFNGAKIILDLKGENCAVCSFWKEQEKVGKSFRLNPWQIFDIPTISYNPFCVLDPFEDDFYDDCIAFADVIIPVKKNQSDTGEHFDDLARDFIASFLLYLTLRDYPEPPNPSTLYDQLIRSTSTIENLRYIADDMQGIPHPDSDIKQALELSALTFKGLISTGENNELRGIKTTISRALRAFKGKRLLNAVKASKEESLNLIQSLFYNNESNDLYISFPQSEIQQAETWLRLVLASFIRDNIKNPPKNPVLFVLDEFPQLGTFNLIKDNAAFLRGYNVRFWFIGQNIGQFKKNYGDEGMQTIFENCTVRQFFNVSDETARYVSQKLGKTISIIKNYETMEFKSSFSKDVMTQTEIEQFQGVINFITGKKPVITARKPYYLIKKANQRALPNPLFHGLKVFKEEKIKLIGNE